MKGKVPADSLLKKFRTQISYWFVGKSYKPASKRDVSFKLLKKHVRSSL
jgi:hypothetical protein